MWVDSIIKRINGHVVEMGGVVYAFNPGNGYGCEVTHPAHLARFREIPEGYQISGGRAPVVEPDTPVEAPQPRKRRTRRFAPAVAPLMPDDQD